MCAVSHERKVGRKGKKQGNSGQGRRDNNESVFRVACICHMNMHNGVNSDRRGMHDYAKRIQ